MENAMWTAATTSEALGRLSDNDGTVSMVKWAGRPPQAEADPLGRALLVSVLSHAIPPGRAATAGEAILAEFGDFASAMAAEPARLQAIPGLGEAAAALLCSVQAAAQELAAARTRNLPVLNSFDRVQAYLAIARSEEEKVELRVIFLDPESRLLADECLSAPDGEPAEVPGNLVRRALEWRAAAMVMIQHRPAGEAMPDDEEILRTHHIHQLAESVGIALHDHVVIGRDTQVSMRQLGLMRGLLRLN